jgi:hypothetical protein
MGLDAWQFVDPQNEPLPKADLDPLRHRRFQFALTAADDQAACRNVDIAEHMPPEKASDGTLIYGIPGYKPPPLGDGLVTLTNIELIHVGKGQRADVKSLGFTADITLP